MQWSRLGDLLQTRPLLDHIARWNPDSRITLCADEQFVPVGRLLGPGVDFCGVDLSRLSTMARHSSTHRDLILTLSASLVAIGDDPADTVYVLSRSRAAATLTALLRPAEIFGYRLQSGELDTPPAIRWLEHRIQTNQTVPLHLADLWCGLDGMARRATWPAALTIRGGANSPPQQGRRVAVLCDAGEDRRSFPQAGLELLLRGLGNCEVTLLGSKIPSRPDCPLARPEIVTDLRGKTSLSQLCEHLWTQDLVIGPDTGGLHLAAALGVPVVGLYFGGAHCFTTGPYTPHAVVAQDPAWNDGALERLCGLIAEGTGIPDITAHLQYARLYTPTLDRSGIAYMSTGMGRTRVLNEHSLEERSVLNARLR